jgi:teichoic acid transport system ATP-binding protein
MTDTSNDTGPDPDHEPGFGPESGFDEHADTDDEQHPPGEPVVVVQDVHITYRTYLDQQLGLADRLRAGFRRSAPRYKDVHAVRGVSLTLHRGESLGIVGSNGSGKSTLLTGIAGLIDLDRGEILAAGRPQLLGVGAVLNRKLSGRRNIEMGCLALGIASEDIDRTVDEISAFTGLEESIDLPLRTYSSGMRARLAFAVATAARPEILLIDEALAVGDRQFRAKAAARLDEICASAGAVIVVSHNQAEISQMCTRVIWLEKGLVVADGPTDEVLELYTATNPEPDRPRRRRRRPRP